MGLDLLGRGPGPDLLWALGPLPLDYLTEILAHFNFVGPVDRLACLGGPPKCLLHLGSVGLDNGPPDGLVSPAVRWDDPGGPPNYPEQ